MMRYWQHTPLTGRWISLLLACCCTLGPIAWAQGQSTRVSGGASGGVTGGISGGISGGASRGAGGDFVNHGVAAPVANGRTVVALEDADGQPIILAWMMRGVIIVDAVTGKSEHYPIPVQLSQDASPFHFLITEDHRFYTLVGFGYTPDNSASAFLEFDIHGRQWRQVGQGPWRAAMSMAHDTDNDIIYAATYPDSHLVAYHRQTGELINHGIVNQEDWAQYPTRLAVDSAGWVYVGIGHLVGNLVAFNPQTGEHQQIPSDDQRKRGRAEVVRAADGMVYAQLVPGGAMYRLHAGQATPIDQRLPAAAHAYKNGWQYDLLPDFPDGSKLEQMDFAERTFRIRDAATGAVRQVAFDYDAGIGEARIYTLIKGPDGPGGAGGKLYGGTGRMLRMFSFDPETSAFEHWAVGDIARGHINAFSLHGHHLFGAIYTGGYPFVYDTTAPRQGDWREDRSASPNPGLLFERRPDIRRPHGILAHSNGDHVLMCGLPDTGTTGGGLLVYSRKQGQGVMLTHEQVIPQHSTYSLLELPGGEVLGGTTIASGGGGAPVLASEAVLYGFDPETHQVTARWTPVPGAHDIRDMVLGSDGLVYGMARVRDGGMNHPLDGRPILFVFDPQLRQVVHTADLSSYGTQFAGMNDGRMLAVAGGMIYVLLPEQIVRLEQGTFAHSPFAKPPVSITTGGVVHNGRIYFASSSSLWSFGF